VGEGRENDDSGGLRFLDLVEQTHCEHEVSTKKKSTNLHEKEG
jgi:hypothetical protein